MLLERPTHTVSKIVHYVSTISAASSGSAWQTYTVAGPFSACKGVTQFLNFHSPQTLAVEKALAFFQVHGRWSSKGVQAYEKLKSWWSIINHCPLLLQRAEACSQVTIWSSATRPSACCSYPCIAIRVQSIACEQR